MSSYYLEFILNTRNSNVDFIRNSLSGLGQELEVLQLDEDGGEKGESFKISILAQDPTLIFDSCAQIGKIKSVKVDERS
jgi:hypothetical protein